MKQKNKIRFLLVAALAGVSVMGYAQGKWCIGATDKPYQIVQVTAPSDAGATFHWTKDGEKISGATSPNLTLPTDLTEGKYTYIRYATKPDCPDAVASNAFTVEVLTCGEVGAGIGDKGTITDDRDKRVYKVVRMPGGQVWMAENLNYQVGLKFNTRADQANGVSFTIAGSGVPAIGSFWCPQLAGTAGSVTVSQNTCNVYGALYTWETAMSEDGKGEWNEDYVDEYYAAADSKPIDDNVKHNNAQNNGRGICPSDFHVPTDFEWATMLDAIESANFLTQSGSAYLGTNVAIMLKSASTYVGAYQMDGSWPAAITSGTDIYGFNALAGGLRLADGSAFDATGSANRFWTSSAGLNSITAYYRNMVSWSGQIGRFTNTRSIGGNLRCVRNY
jgi:uncharacterized protein (TIGR02145 family)